MFSSEFKQNLHKNSYKRTFRKNIPSVEYVALFIEIVSDHGMSVQGVADDALEDQLKNKTADQD